MQILDGYKDRLHTYNRNFGLLYHAKLLLNDESSKIIYFSYIHSYLNYASIAWASTCFTKLKRIRLKAIY